MTHADAFLREILAHPDDDAPRLIFADWLEEQGDPNSIARAEFIRVQCALAAGQLSEQRRAELRKREKQILDEWGKEWVRPIRRLVYEWHFHRGFIDDVAMAPLIFFTYAGRLFRRTPIQHLTLRPISPPLSGNMVVLANNEHLRCLRSLNLSSHALDSQDVRTLVVSEHLTGLASLNLSHNRIGDGGIRNLVKSPLLAQLRELDLGANDFGPAGVRLLARSLLRLARSTEGLHMRRVDLSSNNLGTAGQRVIADSPLLRRLVRI